MNDSISPHFIRGLLNLIEYWHQRTLHLDGNKIALLNQDYPNFLRLVSYGYVISETQLAIAQLILQSFPLIERCGYWENWIPILNDLIEITNDHSQVQFHLLNRLGQVQRLMRQPESAVSSHQKALTLAHQLEDALLLGRVSFQLSADYRLQHSFEIAEMYGMQAMSFFKLSHSEASEIAATLNTLGLIALAQGNLDIAESRLRKAVEYWGTTIDKMNLARTINSLAMTLQQKTQYKEAQYAYQDAIELSQEPTSLHLKLQIQLNLAALYFDRRKFDEAEKIFNKVKHTLHNYEGTLFYEALTMQGLGNVSFQQGHLKVAEIYLRHGLQLWEKIDDKLMLANTVGTLGEVLSAQKNYQEARRFFEQAIDLLILYPNHSWGQQLLHEFREKLDLINEEE